VDELEGGDGFDKKGQEKGSLRVFDDLVREFFGGESH